MDTVIPRTDAQAATSTATPDERFIGEKLLDLNRGVVNRRVYCDEEIYERELERIFHRCWLLLGHDTMIRNSGDYFTTFMGEDPVIVWRDTRGKVRAYLNNCPHRGNRVCLYDEGRAASMTCSYHGWTFTTDGALTGVPFFNEAYRAELPREELGLVEVPKVVSFHGLIFANWDANAPSLEEYLGDLAWYLERLYGDLEILPGVQKWRIVANWKFYCDNFSGDHYHSPTSHLSAILLRRMVSEQQEFEEQRQGAFEIQIPPGHSIAGVHTSTIQSENDLARAERMGPAVVEYVKDHQRRRAELFRDTPAKPNRWSHGLCFPNIALQGGGSFGGSNLFVCHPKGPGLTETWAFYLIDPEAPTDAKRAIAKDHAKGQGPAGLIGLDDGENYERMVANYRSPMHRKVASRFDMLLGHEGDYPGQEEWHKAGLPGHIGPRYSEYDQRQFYRYWAELMDVQA